MKLTLINVILLAMCFPHMELSITCTTPDGLQGRCLRLHACKRLQDISNRRSTLVTLHDHLLLTQSKCESKSKNLYCCPNLKSTAVPMEPLGCITKLGQYGTCTRFDSCPSLNIMLSEPVNVNNLEYIENILRCEEHERSVEFSVCCTPVPYSGVQPMSDNYNIQILYT